MTLRGININHLPYGRLLRAWWVLTTRNMEPKDYQRLYSTTGGPPHPLDYT